MLQKTAIDTDTLELLKKFMQFREFDGFFLAGETALALQIGHRLSVDLDLFTNRDYDEESMLEFLESKFEFRLTSSSPNTLKGIVDRVHVDFIAHKYPLLAPPVLEEGIRLSSNMDIAAIKINAITGNGTRVKDFIDFYFLLEEYSISEIIGFY